MESLGSAGRSGAKAPQLRRRLASVAVLCVSLCGCIHTVAVPSVWAPQESSDKRGFRDLFVFLDGTKNNDRSGTNVWRLFQLVTANGSATTRSIYIEGVGTALHPLTGTLLGVGMERRMRRAYEFLALNYRPGDRIYIFGFSRGAHEARALAGIVSYAGLPVLAESERKNFGRRVNPIVETVKDQADSTYEAAWATWTPEQAPLLGALLNRRLGLKMQSAEVNFLGVWDTVPGSFWKRFGDCAELVKSGRPERYKTRSYPAIKVIAHAMSMDEKRSRFQPLAACSAMDGQRTRVQEVWFPGAHSDVGGGYSDAFQMGAGPPLSNLSFNWMVRLLSQSYTFTVPFQPLPESATALAHWSIGDSPGNWFSKCEDRKQPKGFYADDSVNARHAASGVPINVHGTARNVPYPVKCGDAVVEH